LNNSPYISINIFQNPYVFPPLTKLAIVIYFRWLDKQNADVAY